MFFEQKGFFSSLIIYALVVGTIMMMRYQCVHESLGQNFATLNKRAFGFQDIYLDLCPAFVLIFTGEGGGSVNWYIQEIPLKNLEGSPLITIYT